MSVQSKSSRPRKSPTLTRNGKVRFLGFTLAKLQEMVEKSSRPKDKNKYNNRIKILTNRGS